MQTLEGALITGRIGHAYLFCGPRGTGKTTVARILAKALNCVNFSTKSTKGTFAKVPFVEPCNKCDACLAVTNNTSLDLIEIDAASQTGVDNIRELNDSVRVAAPGGKYKVFLIDEVHMLSKSAFNALLKTLEEPPTHVVFILATTEPHRILPTVLSRVQRFDFRRFSNIQIVKKLNNIIKSEDIKIDDDGLTAIAVSADGALRDAEVALSKVIATCDRRKEISVDEIYSVLGLVPFNYYPEFVSLLASKDRDGALGFVNNIYLNGINLEQFTAGLVGYFRKILIHTINPAVLASVGEELLDNDVKLVASYSQVLNQEQLIRMLNIFVSAKEGIKSSPIPQLPLELAVLELID